MLGIVSAAEYVDRNYDPDFVAAVYSEFYERFRGIRGISFLNTVSELLSGTTPKYLNHHNFVIEKLNLHEETMKKNQTNSTEQQSHEQLIDKEDPQDQYPEFSGFGGLFDMILCCDEEGCVPCEEVEDKMKLELSFDEVLERSGKAQGSEKTEKVEDLLDEDEEISAENIKAFFEMLDSLRAGNDLDDFENEDESEDIDTDEQIEQVHEAMQYLQGLGLSTEQIQILYDEFTRKYPYGSFTHSVLKHKQIRPFAAGGNIFEDSDGIDNETLFIMRWVAGSLMGKVLDALKFDLNDSNLVQDLTVGNIGTAQRWAKTITGSDIEDDTEMMCGRYTTRPRIATFPNNHSKNVPITKICEVSSVCSHHLLAYGTLFDEGANVVVSYIPNEYVLGISKLQRLVNWIAKRPTIQEDLTTEIWKAISEAAQTKDVFVGIYNAKHTCESLRGSKTHEGAFTTEWYDGAFNDESLRMSIIQTAR